MNADFFKGTIPALMTPCDAKGTPDFKALARTGRSLIDAGMSAAVYAGSMGDWPLLTDEQRMEGVEALVAAGVPVVVGTGAQNPKRAMALAAHAKKAGAKGLMVIPRVLSRGSSVAAQRAHFEGILEAAGGLPSVIYNSPYYGYETRADLFFELNKKYPHLVGFKEFGGAASLRYAAEHITSRDSSIMLLVGVDTQVFHGYVNCGAVGAITMRHAQELERALGVLSSFDEGVDLVLYYKYLMVLEGHDEYRLHINPTDALSDSQKNYLTAQHRLFKDWYKAWSAKLPA